MAAFKQNIFVWIKQSYEIRIFFQNQLIQFTQGIISALKSMDKKGVAALSLCAILTKHVTDI